MERPPLRVLLCDDADELRALVRAELEKDGGMVVVGEAADGANAVRLAAQERPDVVLVDLHMPGPDPHTLLVSLARVAPASELVTFSGQHPGHVAAAGAAAVSLHLPKTTGLATVRRALAHLGEKDAS